MPHFRGKEFQWLRGALCTVDRSFGPLLDHCFHHITDTHVCHHLFSKMPFYHAQEATEAFKKVLGPYYLKVYSFTYLLTHSLTYLLMLRMKHLLVELYTDHLKPVYTLKMMEILCFIRTLNKRSILHS
jgi:fatty acid desaturase